MALEFKAMNPPDETTPAETPTPRTDDERRFSALIISDGAGCLARPGYNWDLHPLHYERQELVSAEFARTLERELAAAIVEIGRLNGIMDVEALAQTPTPRTVCVSQCEFCGQHHRLATSCELWEQLTALRSDYEQLRNNRDGLAGELAMARALLSSTQRELASEHDDKMTAIADTNRRGDLLVAANARIAELEAEVSGLMSTSTGEMLKDSQEREARWVKRLFEANAREVALREALREYANRCPDCGGTGIRIIATRDGPEQEQCQWCDTALCALDQPPPPVVPVLLEGKPGEFSHIKSVSREAAEALVEALSDVREMGGKTLLGPGPQDDWAYHDDPKRAHQLGAAKAFQQAADIANAALARWKEALGQSRPHDYTVAFQFLNNQGNHPCEICGKTLAEHPSHDKITGAKVGEVVTVSFNQQASITNQ